MSLCCGLPLRQLCKWAPLEISTRLLHVPIKDVEIFPVWPGPISKLITCASELLPRERAPSRARKSVTLHFMGDNRIGTSTANIQLKSPASKCFLELFCARFQRSWCSRDAVAPGGQEPASSPFRKRISREDSFLTSCALNSLTITGAGLRGVR
jgi:hypothetical protein